MINPSRTCKYTIEQRKAIRKAMGNELSKELFEKCVSAFLEPSVLFKYFITDANELDDFCHREYSGLTFAEAYEALHAQAVQVGEQIIQDWSARGNANAMGLMSKYHLKHEDEADEATLKIVVSADLGDGKGDK